MSRIGKRPIVLQKGVTATFEKGLVSIKGPKGALKFNAGRDRYPLVDVSFSDGQIKITRHDDSPEARTQQGLVRALINNMAVGVHDNFVRILDIVGVGYRAELKGKTLNLSLGFSHPVDFAIPEGITITVDKQTRLTISGADRHLVGEIAAQLRRLRPPEPYKGKGIRYSDEVVRRKVGKAALATTGT